MIKEKISSFQKLAMTAGEYYINSGGPTSRFEGILVRLGKNFGLVVEVFSTTTALFVSVREENSSTHDTQIVRTKSSSKKLVNLVWIESALEKVRSGERTVTWAIKKIPLRCQKNIFPIWLQKIAVFLIGFSASYIYLENILAATCSGFITICVSYISGPLLERWRFSGIFAEFFAGTFSLVIAAILSHFLHVPVKSLLVGGLIYLVPGLRITSAVSELAEQNLVSGTAKLMRGILTIMALGCSFFFVTDLFTVLSINVPVQPITSRVQEISFLQKNIWAIVSITSFSIVFSVPKRHVFFAVLTGLSGWLVLQFLEGQSLFILDSFVPAFLVGTMSLLLSRLTKVPSQIYSVPGILSLVPGMLALSSFYSEKVFEAGDATVPKVAIAACGLVFGLLSSRFPYLLLKSDSYSDDDTII